MIVLFVWAFKKTVQRVQDFGETTNDDFLILYLMDLLNLILFNRQIKFNTEEFTFLFCLCFTMFCLASKKS